MKVKEYEMPDGRKAVFEYDENGVGKITLECMDMLMGLINDRKTENSSEKPNNCEACKYGKCTEFEREFCERYHVLGTINGISVVVPRSKDEPQRLEQFRVGLEYHTDTTHFGKAKGESVTTNKIEDEPQTESE